MNNQNEELELETVEAQYWVDQKKALERLETNDDFKTVILDGYMRDRVLDNVSLLGTEYVKKSGLRPEVMEQLVAISTLQDHFATIKNLGGIAEDDLQRIEGPDVDDEE